MGCRGPPSLRLRVSGRIYRRSRAAAPGHAPAPTQVPPGVAASSRGVELHPPRIPILPALGAPGSGVQRERGALTRVWVPGGHNQRLLQTPPPHPTGLRPGGPRVRSLTVSEGAEGGGRCLRVLRSVGKRREPCASAERTTKTTITPPAPARVAVTSPV